MELPLRTAPGICNPSLSARSSVSEDLNADVAGAAIALASPPLLRTQIHQLQNYELLLSRIRCLGSFADVFSDVGCPETGMDVLQFTGGTLMSSCRDFYDLNTIIILITSTLFCGEGLYSCSSCCTPLLSAGKVTLLHMSPKSWMTIVFCRKILISKDHPLSIYIYVI
jgi:hypothetical protein